MSERLELVRSFDELRAGMIVVVKRGHHCNRSHRVMLIGPGHGPLYDCQGNVCDPEPTLYVLPKPPCQTLEFAVVSPSVVARRKVWRVVDPGLESSDTYRRSLEADEDLAVVRAHQRKRERAKEGGR